MFQVGREAGLFPVRDLAALPGGTQPFLPESGLDARMGVGDAQSGPLHAPRLELAEEGPPGVLRLVEHGLNSQDLPRTGGIDAAGDNHGHRDDPSFNPDLLIKSIDPEEGILLSQRPSLEVLDLGVELLVELRDLAGRDVLDAYRVGQTLDLPDRDAVDEGFLDDRDQGLFGPPSLRDEERDIAALADLGDKKMDRPQASIDPPAPRLGEVGRTIPGMLPLGRPDLGFGFNPHHLRHHSLEHGQEGIRLPDEL